MGLDGLVNTRKYDAARLADGSILPVPFALPRGWNTPAAAADASDKATKERYGSMAIVKCCLRSHPTQTLLPDSERGSDPVVPAERCAYESAERGQLRKRTKRTQDPADGTTRDSPEDHRLRRHHRRHRHGRSQT